MKANTPLIRVLLLVFVMVVGAWSCAGRPFDPPRSDEIPKEPGVFTKGADGVVLYDSNKERLPDASPSQMPAATESGVMEQPAGESGYEAYEDYRQWLLWKKSAVGTAEYEDIQQWRAWRKYQEWKKQQ